jgi:uncharacterized protein (DUF1015 family)
MFDDKDQVLIPLLNKGTLGKPIINIDDYDAENHRLYAVTDPEVIEKITGFFADRPLYIADGHHRYESSLTYQREQRAIHADAPADSAFNYTMMALVDFDDPGLLVLPPHRLMRGLPPAGLNDLEAKLKEFFDIEEMPLNLPNLWKRVDNLLADDSQIRLFLYGLDEQNLFLLTLRDFNRASQMMPYFHSPLYKKLDVSVVDHVILEELLGMNSLDEARINYNYNHRDAVKQVQAKDYQLAFIISPVRSWKIKEIADAGDRMPRKSTYFYPKLPSGLVINRLI